LPPEPSAHLRTRFLVELDGLNSEDQLAQWARRILPLKNTMTIKDASAIEETFRAKLTAIEQVLAREPRVAQPETETLQARSSFAARDKTTLQRKRSSPTKAARIDRGPHSLADSANQSGLGEPVSRVSVDKSELTLSEPRRYRNRAHLDFVASQPCLICERRPSDPHHLRFAQPSALGRRVSDEFTVPLCRSHHRALHRRGNEAEWWRENGIDPVEIAQRLWERTRRGDGATQTRFFQPN